MAIFCEFKEKGCVKSNPSLVTEQTRVLVSVILQPIASSLALLSPWYYTCGLIPNLAGSTSANCFLGRKLMSYVEHRQFLGCPLI